VTRAGGFPPAGLALLALLIGLAAPAAAADAPLVEVRASALARQGRCDEALALLEGAAPSAQVASLRGKCLLELRRYPQAVAAFEEAKRLDPSLEDVDLHLAMARFHQGDLDGARAALDDAEATSSDRAEYHLYRGLLLLQQAQSRDAADSFERARALDARVVDPAASYYAGLAWAASEDERRAEEALRRAKEMAPGTSWAAEADRALSQIGEGGAPSRWAWVKAGFEYDDNVVLRGKGVTLPEEISGTHDVRGVWQGHAGIELLRSADWSAGVTATYYGSAHFDLDEFDEHYPVVGVWLDRRLAESTVLRLRYDAGYAWVDYDPFLFSHAASATLFQEWGREVGRSRAFARYYRDNYLFPDDEDVPDGPGRTVGRCLDPDDIVCSPPGIDESQARNRDGDGFLLGVEHDLPIRGLNTEVTFGYRYDHFGARGREYSYQGHELRLETLSLLPWDLQLRSLVSYTYKPYRHASTFPDPGSLFLNREYFLQNERRHDDVWAFQVELEKFWTDRFSTSVAYTYIKNHSNVAVFDYDREITGIYVTWRFGP
jgi:tetratricopeptide (TPR) repeat protein